jgi:hypothetical protein
MAASACPLAPRREVRLRWHAYDAAWKRHEKDRNLPASTPATAWFYATDPHHAHGGRESRRRVRRVLQEKARLLSPDTIDLPLDDSVLQRSQRQTQE